MENPGRKKKGGRAVRKQPELMKTRYDRLCKIPKEERKDVESVLDERKKETKEPIVEVILHPSVADRGAHACGGEESSLDDVLEGPEWSGCVRVPRVRTGRCG